MSDRYDIHKLHIPLSSGSADWEMAVELSIVKRLNLVISDKANLTTADIGLINDGYQELVAIATLNGYTEA